MQPIVEKLWRDGSGVDNPVQCGMMKGIVNHRNANFNQGYAMTETIETPKKNRIAKRVLSEDGLSVSFTFNDEGGTVRAYAVDGFPTPVQSLFAQFGASRKLSNFFAENDGIEDAISRLDAGAAVLMSGVWRVPSEGGVGPKAGKTVTALLRIGDADKNLAKAIRKILGIEGEYTKESIRDAFATADKDVKATVMKSKQVKAELATMAAEEAEDSGTSLLG